MSTSTPARPVARVMRPRERSAIGSTVTAILLALLVGWLFTEWWTAPNPSTLDTLERQVAAGEVESSFRTNGVDDGGLPWGFSLQPRNVGEGPILAWQTTDGRTWYVVASGPSGPAPDGTAAGPTRADIEAAERALAGPPFSGGYHVDAGPMLGLLLLLGGLFVLVNGPDPVRGTRWFWFWVGGLTAGAGVLAWLLLERVWPPRRAAPAGSRFNGWTGVAILVLGSLLLPVALSSVWAPYGTFG